MKITGLIIKKFGHGINRILLIYILCAALFSCSEDPNIPDDDLTGKASLKLVPEPAKAGEEVTLEILYLYPNPTSDMEVFVEESQVDILENNTTSVKFVLPENIDTLIIKVEHSDGWAKEQGFEKIPTAVITSFSPKQGKEGDIITITGFDLLGCQDKEINVLFNTTPAEILTQSDTLITVKVPLNAGNGPLRIYQNSGTYGDCIRIDTISTQIFTYQFETGVDQYLKQINGLNNSNTTYERDIQNRVIKEITWYNVSKFVYGSDGLIDTIFEYNDIAGFNSGDVKSFKVYNHENYPETIEVIKYNPKVVTHLQEKNVYEYTAEKLINNNNYYWNDTDSIWELGEENRYVYEDNHAYWYNKLSYTNEAKHGDWVYDVNNKKMDLNIPGKEYIHLYNILFDDITNTEYRLTYDQYGYLVKIEWKDIYDDTPFAVYETYTYE